MANIFRPSTWLRYTDRRTDRATADSGNAETRSVAEATPRSQASIQTPHAEEVIDTPPPMPEEVLSRDRAATHSVREQIEALAYAKWCDAGCPPGDGAEFWLAAEREVLASR
ncbi:hypothetical protein Pan216_17910 [Planctomycetes bacterium Pan216]|uniref:DUF2934 domain-containing protein n=1 Tax=Kolteria novifilia TaxID=2527975 RepID=A0A518B1U4_9BACT|nr:hypothetical protein Pan216_17910 [Planctomycetes bacterium Pan216]